MVNQQICRAAGTTVRCEALVLQRLSVQLKLSSFSHMWQTCTRTSKLFVSVERPPCKCSAGFFDSTKTETMVGNEISHEGLAWRSREEPTYKSFFHFCKNGTLMCIDAQTPVKCTTQLPTSACSILAKDI
ncbi:hypothetical protein EVAR_21450_1 [Eumeta japonica]|uniref:Uncharacterized protein n=1 Tax=Eumeta variegata TaxID=151549 RepID=A0A4C1VJ27_EUMVA|nr:hypothetical protein EVAR_21450_1 [Eumeta japonica]